MSRTLELIDLGLGDDFNIYGKSQTLLPLSPSIFSLAEDWLTSHEKLTAVFPETSCLISTQQKEIVFSLGSVFKSFIGEIHWLCLEEMFTPGPNNCIQLKGSILQCGYSHNGFEDRLRDKEGIPAESSIGDHALPTFSNVVSGF